MPSRIGKQLIKLPEAVKLNILEDRMEVTGPKGNLTLPIFKDIAISVADQNILCQIIGEDNASSKAYQGLIRSLLANAIHGVDQGWEKKLDLVGVGYKSVSSSDGGIELSLGLSHTIKVPPVDEITFEVKSNKITISGIDKQKVGQIAAKIRDLKKPEPYKGKGIRYHGEKVRQKAGKTAKAIGGK